MSLAEAQENLDDGKRNKFKFRRGKFGYCNLNSEF